jgi:predicted RNA-binding protein with PIN domain
MAILIDGYNLLHVTGIFGRGQGPGGFERSRRALLNFLVESIGPEELPRTTVVFDAAEAPPGLPRKLKHGPITVHYATENGSADALIELLISKHNSPRRLTVVSSDHRLHRAAGRRRATAVDSEIWYAALVESRRQRNLASPVLAAKPEVPLSPAQIEYWLTAFGADAQQLAADASFVPSPVIRSAAEASAPDDDTDGDATDATRRDLPVFNPFPPGYAEDVGRE